MSVFSENEVKLFTALDSKNLLDSFERDPVGLYFLCIREVFLENRQGPEVEALRRAGKVLRDSSICRHTDEFENLIDLNLKISFQTNLTKLVYPLMKQWKKEADELRDRRNY